MSVLAIVLLAAFIFRVVLAFVYPALNYPDEIYQATEQGHRLAFGYGILPWEFRTGSRNWLLPGALAAVMAIASWASSSAGVYLAAIVAGSAALSLLPVWAAWDIGRRFSRDHALLAAVAVAASAVIAHDGVRTLTEVVATDFLLPAVALLSDRRTPRRLFLGGLCLGLSFVFRFHLAPALGLLALAGGGRDWRERWLPMLAGAAIPVLTLGLVDWWTWGAPFASIMNNFRVNAIVGRANMYGTSVPLAYLVELATRWGIFAVLTLPFIIAGAIRKPLLLIVAVVIVATYSLVPHKEYRFIFPAEVCLVILAGLGVAECLDTVRRRTLPRAARLLLPTALALLVGAGIAFAFTPGNSREFFTGRNALNAFAALSRDGSICGVAIAGRHWFEYPGYSVLHRPVGIYLWSPLAAAGKQLAVNVVVVSGDNVPPADPAYSLAQCFDDPHALSVCLYRRAGACTPAAGLEVNAYLMANNY